MMKTIPAWQFNEFMHVGVNYADPAMAREYDAQHEQFRGDMVAECDRLLDWLEVQPGKVIIDMGCGTGAFAVQATRRGAVIYAVDVSEAMLAVAKEKARAAGVTNINFCHGGFLTYEHLGEQADLVVSTSALHHLPDFWKGVALRRIAGMLKEGGRFYLQDVVYSFTEGEHARVFDEKVAWFNAQVNGDFAREVEITFSDEYGTYDWIMEGLLARAGFAIEDALFPDEMTARYLCTKLRS
jgi:ubiquinone/menaquinone biosynthesis C-methylase UbiE